MKRRSFEDSWQALTRVTDAAERFVNRSPRLKTLEAERQNLLDAIRQSQLLLSVKRLPIPESLSREQREQMEHPGRRSTRSKKQGRMGSRG